VHFRNSLPEPSVKLCGCPFGWQHGLVAPSDKVQWRARGNTHLVDTAGSTIMTKNLCVQTLVLVVVVGLSVSGNIPEGYKGTAFHDANHIGGPQTIPGRLQATLYDLGGEGVAYHDTDTVNHGSGELNYKPGHCEEGVPAEICHFREGEGVDISYVKKQADLNHPNMVTPEWQQLYIGWTEDGEWTKYTVEVKKAGRYKIVAMYSNLGQTIQFSLNDKPAADCKLPVDTWKGFPVQEHPEWMTVHMWNKAECGEIDLPQAGPQVLTLHYRKGNNLAYFDFVSVE